MKNTDRKTDRRETDQAEGRGGVKDRQEVRQKGNGPGRRKGRCKSRQEDRQKGNGQGKRKK